MHHRTWRDIERDPLSRWECVPRKLGYYGCKKAPGVLLSLPSITGLDTAGAVLELHRT